MATTQTAYVEKRRSVLFGLPLKLTQYVIDDTALSEQFGLFSVTTHTVALAHVRNMAITQSALQKLFGLSTVHVATTDPHLSEFTVHNIRQAEAFVNELKKHTAALRQTATV